jgi:RNA polymerase sigma-70 factor (ECF subfamily)
MTASNPLGNQDAELLLRAARSGDIQAFATLFESFRGMVFRVAVRLTGENDAEDVVMETYLKAWQSLPGFHARAALKTWLYRIAYTVSVDLLRARERRARRFIPESEIDPDQPFDAADVTQQTADEAVESRDTAGAVQGVLKRLPAEHRTALMMRFADDMSYAEIAAATGVSIGTVMSRLFYGKKKLKDLLKGSELDG